MTQEEIIEGFVAAGWRMGGRCDDDDEGMLVGYAGDLSILADASQVGAEDAAFELYDGQHGVTYWVRVIPTPRVARVLLDAHGGPTGEERSNPHG